MLVRHRADADLTFVDLFCGAGGSSLGLTLAGWRLVAALNHWRTAVNTHQANFPHAMHRCVDISKYDMRQLPRARVLWASVICTEGSPAGGNAKTRGNDPTDQLDLLTDQERAEREAIEDEGWELTRATAHDVIRATDIWQFDVVIVENVLEFITNWPRFWWWLRGMTDFGYQVRIVSMNSAHIWDEDNPPAPQWRDRVFIVFVREGIAMPDLEPRPWAYCFDCRTDVQARQTWKDTKLTRRIGEIGKYRDQYIYTCPNTARRHEFPILEPYVLPAAAAIDWSDLGTAISDRKPTKKKPEGLAPATMAKIRAGAAMISQGPTIVQVNHAGHQGRHFLSTDRPLSARTVRGGDGLATLPGVMAPFITEHRGGGSVARPANHPLSTVSAQGNHHGLVVPDDRISWGDGHGLVIPYRRGAATTTATPLHTVATRDSAALVRPERDLDVRQFRFRMLRAREHLRAQRIDPDTYIVTGTNEEQTQQAGNAVSSNCAQFLGQRIAAALVA